MASRRRPTSCWPIAHRMSAACARSPWSGRGRVWRRCVAVEVGNRTKLCVTRGSRQASQVLKILKLSELDLPEPPLGRETLMW